MPKRSCFLNLSVAEKVLLKITTSEQAGIYEMDWTYDDTGFVDEYPGNFNRDEFVDLKDGLILLQDYY